MDPFDWGEDGPPEQAYGRVTRPERFALLHEVADAIVEDLRARFDARVTPLTEVPQLLAHLQTTRIVRVDPPNQGTPITFAWTPFPGVALTYGWWQQAVLPACGCDACGEDCDTESEMLREAITEIVEQGFTEELSRQTPASLERARRERHPPIDRATLRRLGGGGPRNPVAWLARRIVGRRQVWWLCTDAGLRRGQRHVEGQIDQLASLHRPERVTWPAWR